MIKVNGVFKVVVSILNLLILNCNFSLSRYTADDPILVVHTGRGAQVRKAKFKVSKMVDIMGWKAIGTKLVDFTKSVEMEWEKKAGSKSEDQQPELF